MSVIWLIIVCAAGRHGIRGDSPDADSDSDSGADADSDSDADAGSDADLDSGAELDSAHLALVVSHLVVAHRRQTGPSHRCVR